MGRKDCEVPLVVTQNLATEEGHSYRDLLGAEYEYPLRYEHLMQTGEPFVYYRGRRGRSAGELPYAYIGAAVVGVISESQTAGRLTARVEDYTPFASPVPLQPDGDYIENVPRGRGSATGMFFRRSVRPLSDAAFRRILGLAGQSAPAGPAVDPTGHYPDPEHARAVDEAGMRVAERAAGLRWPSAQIARMPQNNPGYDLRVDLADGPWFVEVKSTAGSVEQFFISEGERAFAERHSRRYSLLVITGVDPAGDAGNPTWRDGALTGVDLVLRPRQWHGRLMG